MRIFVAGSTGAIGRTLISLLVDAGHEVAGLARDTDRVALVTRLGATAVVADAFDRAALTAAVEKAKPDVVVHQLTALARVRNLKQLDREMALTNRLRTEVTDTLIAAARSAGAQRVIAQSFCGWTYARQGGPVKSEDDPLDPSPPASFGATLAAIRYLEDAVQAAVDIDGIALRYGMFYGPGTQIGTNGAIVAAVRKRQLPIVGHGGGVWSFVHIADAARATVGAVTRGAPGLYNVVDDEPAPVSAWLPALATAVGAKPPRRIPVWIGKLAIGDGGVKMMTENRGASNAKARNALDWQPRFASWRHGFVEGLGH